MQNGVCQIVSNQQMDFAAVELLIGVRYWTDAGGSQHHFRSQPQGSDFQDIDRANVVTSVQSAGGNPRVLHSELDEIDSWLHRRPTMCPETPGVVGGLLKVIDWDEIFS